MTELEKAYQSYCDREFDGEGHIVGDTEFGIFYADYKLEDGSYVDLEVTLFANEDNCEYIAIKGGNVVAYRETVSYKQAIDELRWCGFDDFYSYFGDRCIEYEA